MQKYLRMTFAGAAFVAVCAAPALAVDTLEPGKILVVKSGKLAKVVIKPATPPAPLPAIGPNDPVNAGGSVLFRDLGNSSNFNSYTLPAGGWKGLGNPPGTKGYKYKGAGGVGDPCRVVLVKEKVIKAVCKGPDVTMTTPVTDPPAVVAVNIGAGTDNNYCAEFGGTQVKNTVSVLKRKNSGAPSACSSPSGAFLDGDPLF
jgi:hypothetical protein